MNVLWPDALRCQHTLGPMGVSIRQVDDIEMMKTEHVRNSRANDDKAEGFHCFEFYTAPSMLSVQCMERPYVCIQMLDTPLNSHAARESEQGPDILRYYYYLTLSTQLSFSFETQRRRLR